MLCATIRRAPAARAASTRMRVPSLRRRSLSAKSRSILRGSMRARERGQLVDHGLGRGLRARRRVTASRVERVGDDGLGALRPQRRALLRASASCPSPRGRRRAASARSRRPITPVAPARKTLMTAAARSAAPTFGAGSGHRADHALAEAGGADAEREVEAPAHVLERDHVGQLDELGVVEVLAQLREQLVATRSPACRSCRRRSRARASRARRTRSLVAVARQREQLLVARRPARRAICEPMSMQYSQLRQRRRLQLGEHLQALGRRGARFAVASSSMPVAEQQAAARARRPRAGSIISLASRARSAAWSCDARAAAARA